LQRRSAQSVRSPSPSAPARELGRRLSQREREVHSHLQQPLRQFTKERASVNEEIRGTCLTPGCRLSRSSNAACKPALIPASTSSRRLSPTKRTSDAGTPSAWTAASKISRSGLQ